MLTIAQFMICMHYGASTGRELPLTVILRAQILSASSLQLRYLVRGTQGTFTKHGVDPQEDQLKALASPTGVHGAGFGHEEESLSGKLQNLEADGVSIREST